MLKKYINSTGKRVVATTLALTLTISGALLGADLAKANNDLTTVNETYTADIHTLLETYTAVMDGAENIYHKEIAIALADFWQSIYKATKTYQDAKASSTTEDESTKAFIETINKEVEAYLAGISEKDLLIYDDADEVYLATFYEAFDVWTPEDELGEAYKADVEKADDDCQAALDKAEDDYQAALDKTNEAYQKVKENYQKFIAKAGDKKTEDNKNDALDKAKDETEDATDALEDALDALKKVQGDTKVLDAIEEVEEALEESEEALEQIGKS